MNTKLTLTIEQSIIEKAAIEDAEKELVEYERRKPNKEKKKAVRQPFPDHLRREIEVIEPEGIQDNWVRIGEEVTEILEHKPGEIYVRRIERPNNCFNMEIWSNSYHNNNGDMIKNT